jgi:outer membrane protein assembly factor BamB
MSPATQPCSHAAKAVRRRWFVALVAAALVFRASVCGAEGNWPQFRGNSQLTGVADTTPPARPEVLWQFKTGENFGSSAAIVNGVVYVGCDDGHLYAINLKDGKLKWKSEPALFAGNSTSKPLAAAIQSSPAVHQGLIFFGDEDGMFHALDLKTGKQKWTFKTDAEIISSPNPIGDRVVFGSYDGNLYCLKVHDGALIWKVKTEGRVHGTPGIFDGKVVVAGCDEKLRVVSLMDGGAVAAVPMGSVSGASAAILNGDVYVGTFGNQVHCMDLAAGKFRWTFDNADKDFPFYASAAVTNDLVVIGGRDKVIHAIDRKSGKERWSFKTHGRVDSSAVIVGDRAFVGSSDGNLYGLRLADGNETWRFETGSAITASPAAAEGRLVVGTEDGILYCFGEKSNVKKASP